MGDSEMTTEPMYLEITCPSCGKKIKISLTGAERKISELREQLKRERDKHKYSNPFGDIFGGT